MDSNKNKRICMAQPWAQLTLCLMMLTTTVTAFLPHSGLQHPAMASRSTAVRQMAAIDPNDLANFVHQHPTLDAILSTLYAVEMPVDVRERAVRIGGAHGHSNPLFGPPDPWLKAMKSIPPTNLKNLVNVQTGPSQEWPEAAKAAFEKGKTVVDTSTFQAGGGSVLPGFKPTGGILPKEVVVDSSLKTIENQTRFVGSFLNVLEKMPLAAFVYAVIEFGILRKDVNIYKEDIEEEPLEVAAEVMAVTGVRLVTFFLIGLATFAIFGHDPPTV